MKSTEIIDSTKEYEKIGGQAAKSTFVLTLFVTGTTPKSLRAIRNLKRVCEECLKDRYQLKVVDIYQQPELARAANILAAPTLIKHLPLPIRRVIGDMADRERLLAGIDVKPKK